MHGKYFAAMLVALALAGPSIGNAADDAKALQAQAEAAYDRKDFAASAGYFAQAYRIVAMDETETVLDSGGITVR